MKLTFEITYATVLQGRGADRVSLHTTEPSPVPGVTTQSLCLDFVAAQGGGQEYVRQLGFPEHLTKIIDV